MKNIIQFIALLVMVCAVLWLIGSRIAKIEERESQLSPYQVYDPFKEDLEVVAEKQATLKQEDPSQSAQASPVATATEEVIVEDDFSDIELKVNYDKLAANISRTSISNIFFTKSQSVCSVPNSFNAIYDSLRKSDLPELLLTIEPLLPRADDFSPSKAKISLKTLTRDNILNVNFQNKGRPQLVGLYLCSDKENSGSCATKKAGSLNITNDGVFFFSYAYFDLESFSLLTFPEDTKKERYIDKFARSNFGPIDKSNLAYLNSKVLASNLSSSIRLKNSASSLSFIFPFYNSDTCEKKVEKVAPEISGQVR